MVDAVRLKVLNELENEFLATAAARKIAEVFGLETNVEAAKLKKPEQAYDSQRRQYNAATLLIQLEPSPDLILLITDRDIYVPGLNFVFGYAPGKAGVVSTCRLDPVRTEGRADPNLLLRRTVKEAVHETGHLLGLLHCTTPGCVMNFSNSVPEVDLKQDTPCRRCLSRITFLRPR
ncbi:MAG: archaemetzincin family Zn-dependent metalloprotease [Candidatus Caldarchaeum sp.]|nr:archaemetzincin family Zn-dependent metalloprotease [Candidatus Caldarchaeum sp.]